MSAWWFIKARSSYWQGPGRKLQSKEKILYSLPPHSAETSKTCWPHGSASSHQHSTHQTSFISLFSLLPNTVFFSNKDNFKNCSFLRETGHSPSLKDKIEQETLHWEQLASSKMKCQAVGMWGHWLSELLCVLSATVEVTGPGSCLPGLHVCEEFIKRPVLSIKKLALTRQNAKPKNIYLFWLMIGQVILPSVTWLFSIKQNMKHYK